MSIGASIIENSPRLAELVGRIAINWSGVEVQLALALGSMLGVQNSAAVAVFLSLRNHRAQRDALRAAASRALSGEVAEIFDAILSRHEELDKQRNQSIHCVWGKSDVTPDGIVWSSQQDHANMLITAYHLEQTSQLTHESSTYNMTKDLFVARYADLEQLNEAIKALDRTIGNFHAYLRYRTELAGQNAYRSLVEDPVIIQKRTAKPTL